MEPVLTKETTVADLGQKDGKQVVGKSCVKHPGQPAVNHYILDDGSTVMEDENGKAVAKWPEPPKPVKEAESETDAK